MVKQFGKNLYVEVHIHAARDGKGIGPLELEEMKEAADVLNKAVDEVDSEAESGEESDEDPKKGKTPAKRAAEADPDEDYVQGAGMGSKRDSKRKKGKGRKG